MKTKTLLIAGATLALSVATSQALTPVNLDIPGGNALSFICLPWSPNPVSPLEFLAYLQGGETLYIWNGSVYHSYTYAGYGVGTGMGYPSDFYDANPPSIPGEVYDSDNQVYWAPDHVFKPGESFWIMNPNATIHCTILGLGPLTQPVQILGGSSLNFVGNAMTTGGDAEGTVINMTANFAGGEIVYVWNGSGYYTYRYEGAGMGTLSDFSDANPPSIPGEVYDPISQVYWTPPLMLNIGQGLIISNPNAEEQWVQQITWKP